MSGFTQDIALLSLFARNVAARPDTRALIGADGTSFTYSDASNAVTHLAQQIASLGLPPRSSIALLLPNSNELALALLAIMHCGHVAVPMPVAWRKSDLVRACREAEAAALLTTANFTPENLPALAAEVAIEVFELSFPCAFGEPLPDGIMPLTFSTSENTAKFTGTPSQGIATMQPASGGVSFVLHRDEELLAAGLGVMLSADMQSEDNIASAVSLSNYAGLSTAFVPWLLSGGSLTLLPDVSQSALQHFNKRTHLLAPVGAVRTICALLDTPLASVAAVHFCGNVLGADFSEINARRHVDVVAFNEVCAIALPRTDASKPLPLPLGAVHAGNNGTGSLIILESSISENGNILLRGALVPESAMQGQEWLDTGYGAIAADTAGVYAKRPADLIALGALRFNFPELERRILSATLVSSVEVIDDELLGNRLLIASERPDETSRALIDAGLPRIIAKAAQKSNTLRARSA